MNDLQLFNFENKAVRSLPIDGEPWLVGKDVAEALGYSNPRDAINRHVDDDDKGVVKHDTPGGVQNITVINESGMYALIFGSKLPSAKRFKKWVTSEVLPQIREYGAYAKTPINLVGYNRALKLADNLSRGLPNRYEVVRILLEPFNIRLPEITTALNEPIQDIYNESVMEFVGHKKIPNILDKPIKQVHNEYKEFCELKGFKHLQPNAFSRRLKVKYGICSDAKWNIEQQKNVRVYKVM